MINITVNTGVPPYEKTTTKTNHLPTVCRLQSVPSIRWLVRAEEKVGHQRQTKGKSVSGHQDVQPFKSSPSKGIHPTDQTKKAGVTQEADPIKDV
jgi:hypothetical protein